MFLFQATHFVELCSQRDIPLVFCQNTVPQANSELTADQRACLLKDQAKLMTAVACAQVGNGREGRGTAVLLFFPALAILELCRWFLLAFSNLSCRNLAQVCQLNPAVRDRESSLWSIYSPLR